MDKRVQKRLKRDELDRIMKQYPALDRFLENLTDDDIKDVELEKIIESSVEDMMQKEFMRGVQTGYMGAMIGVYKKISNYNTVENAVDYLKGEADKFCKRLGINSVEELEKFGEDDG